MVRTRTKTYPHHTRLMNTLRSKLKAAKEDQFTQNKAAKEGQSTQKKSWWTRLRNWNWKWYGGKTRKFVKRNRTRIKKRVRL